MEYKKDMGQRYLFRQEAFVFCNFEPSIKCDAKNTNGRPTDPVSIYKATSR